MRTRLLILAAFLMVDWVSATTTQVVTVEYNTLETELSGDLNNTTPSADALLPPYGGTYAPTYWSQFDVDYYRLDVADAPATLTIHVTGFGSVVIQGDPELWLEDAHGSILAHNDDIAPIYNLDCYIRYVFSAPGDYYARVEHSQKNTWYYNYSNYRIWGDYEYIAEKPNAVGPRRWMLYK